MFLFIEYGSGSNKKGCLLKGFVLNEKSSSALVPYQDYTHSPAMTLFPHLFRKGQLKCWKIFKKSSKLEDQFSQLGAGPGWDLSDSLFDELEEYVCNLYGYCEKNINKVRWLLLQKKHAKEKVIDLSALPPHCPDVLRIHSEKADFVAKVWISSLKNRIGEESFTNHGWGEYSDIRWIDQAYPDDQWNIFQ